MFKKASIATVSVFLVAELIIRILGIADVPIREANSVTGYIPMPSQSGKFLNNTWTINKMRMISKSEFKTDGNEVLIAGDSVVFGGNPLDQAERVGEQLDKLLPNQDVFSIAEGSWGFKNSLNYIEQNIDLLAGTETIVFVLNSADFSAPSQWRCNSFHPTTISWSHLYFALRKYTSPECLKQTPSDFRVEDYDAFEKFTNIQTRLQGTRFVIYLYQKKDEFANSISLKNLLDERFLREVEVKETLDFSEMWSVEYFSDGIHTTPDGAEALAKILQKVI